MIRSVFANALVALFGGALMSPLAMNLVEFRSTDPIQVTLAGLGLWCVSGAVLNLLWPANVVPAITYRFAATAILGIAAGASAQLYAYTALAVEQSRLNYRLCTAANWLATAAGAFAIVTLLWHLWIRVAGTVPRRSQVRQ
jgi:hypothetical protein